jgi:transposase
MNEGTSSIQLERDKVLALEQKVQSLEHQLDWFKRQLFGRKSEKRIVEPNPEQPLLDGFEVQAPAPAKPDKQIITYTRTKQRGSDCATDVGLRFDDTVPKKTIHCAAPELSGPNAHEYEHVSDKHTYRLAQRPVSYEVLEYVHPVLKHTPSNTLISTPAPASLWPGSVVDVSFVVGMLVDKFVYHQPLYRQHQRLAREGIVLARATLSNITHRAIALLEPIYDAQLRHILLSRILAIDETPIKAGRKEKGTMRLGWYWPIYGLDDEVAFTFSRSRGSKHLLSTLNGFNGTVLSDGHSAYRSYAKAVIGTVHAQCWTHTRREFVKAENDEPEAVAQAFELIGALYLVEAHIRDNNMNLDQTLACRAEHAKPAVDAFFAWCEQQCHRMDLVPSSPFSKALKYARSRDAQLRLYLADPELALDTNHLERTLRVIPMGRKSWLFCWTEVGAQRVGIIQSLLTTCRLHGIDPHTYLTDVLQRVAQHPASRVEELTPRVWKTMFADNPLRSDVYRPNVNNGPL